MHSNIGFGRTNLKMIVGIYIDDFKILNTDMNVFDVLLKSGILPLCILT